MLTKKILLEYEEQNPDKFKSKFGELDLDKLDGEIKGYVKDKDGEDVVDNRKRRIPIFKQYTTEEVKKIAGVKVDTVEQKKESPSVDGGDTLKDNDNK